MKIFSLILPLLFMANSIYAQGSILMVGGGREDYNSWSDKPYGWFVQQADSGKIINIDVDETSSWYAGYFESFGASSNCHAMRIASRTVANDSSTYHELVSVNGIFIEGGDQWDYVSTWRGTLVQDAIHFVFNNGGAIGGTSAGLAVLGEVVFDAQNGSAYPEETAYNAWDPKISLSDDFLNILPSVLCDSHFHPRGRLGRLVPMLAQRIIFYDEDLLGIGIDDKTALCVNPDRNATCYGKGSVTIIHKTPQSKIESKPGEPVQFTHIRFHQLVHGMSYDLVNRAAINPDSLLEPVIDLLPASGYSNVTIDGANPNSASLGEIEIEGLTGDELNAWYGRLQQTSGDTTIPRAVIIPKIWYEYDYYENRLIGGVWGVATNPGFVAIYLDTNTSCQISENGLLTAHTFAYILDTHDMRYVGFPQKNIDSAPIPNSNHPGMIGAMLHFLNDSSQYDLKQHRICTAIENEAKKIPQNYCLNQNYPNPFHSNTTIKFDLDICSEIDLFVYNIKGERIVELASGYYPDGLYSITWDGKDNTGENVSSGVYFYCLRNGDHFVHKKMMFLK